MIKNRKVKYFECDGCQYLINEGDLIIRLSIPLKAGLMEEFHFHNIAHPTHSDCFRYWNQNPYVIRRSMKERGFSNDEIDSYLSHLSYREDEKKAS